MRKSIPATLLVLFSASTILASSMGSMPQPQSASPMSAPDPHAQAIQSFNEGLKYRDRAWVAEKDLAATQDAGKRANAEERIRKSYAADIRSQKTALHFEATMYQAETELGYALRKSGDYNGSLEAYGRALELMPNYAEALEYRAEAYLALDRVDDARGTYMTLYVGGDKDRSQTLATAMQKWVAAHSSAPGSVAPEKVDELAKWLSQRAEISAQNGAVAKSSSWR